MSRQEQPPMPIPDEPFVGLYGSHTGPWRRPVIRKLQQAGIRYFDPTDSAAWSEINDDNGDEKQPQVDELVEKQHQGMLQAQCVVFHLARWRDPADPSGKKDEVCAFAARCELGFLTGRGIPTFVHIDNDVLGRNYLWAEMKLYAHMHRCDSLEDAADQAIAFMEDQAERT